MSSDPSGSNAANAGQHYSARDHAEPEGYQHTEAAARHQLPVFLDKGAGKANVPGLVKATCARGPLSVSAPVLKRVGDTQIS